jgi:hypothetical protein
MSNSLDTLSTVAVHTSAFPYSPTGTPNRSPDRTARSQSLYRLSYLAHTVLHVIVLSKYAFYRVARRMAYFLSAAWVAEN